MWKKASSMVFDGFLPSEFSQIRKRHAPDLSDPKNAICFTENNRLWVFSQLRFTGFGVWSAQAYRNTPRYLVNQSPASGSGGPPRGAAHSVNVILYSFSEGFKFAKPIHLFFSPCAN